MSSWATAVACAPAASSALTQSTCPAQAARCSAVRRCSSQGSSARRHDVLSAHSKHMVRTDQAVQGTVYTVWGSARCRQPNSSSSLPAGHAAPGWLPPRSGRSAPSGPHCGRQHEAGRTWPRGGWHRYRGAGGQPQGGSGGGGAAGPGRWARRRGQLLCLIRLFRQRRELHQAGPALGGRQQG